jgi:hypothetical protein
MGYFAELFVFNDLIPFSFRANRRRRPGPMKRRANLSRDSEKQ